MQNLQIEKNTDTANKCKTNLSSNFACPVLLGVHGQNNRDPDRSPFGHLNPQCLDASQLVLQQGGQVEHAVQRVHVRRIQVRVASQRGARLLSFCVGRTLNAKP